MQYEYRATTHAGASSKIQLGVGHRPRNEDEDEQLQGTAVVWTVKIYDHRSFTHESALASTYHSLGIIVHAEGLAILH